MPRLARPEDIEQVYRIYMEREGKVAGFYRITQFEGRARHVAQPGTLAKTPMSMKT